MFRTCKDDFFICSLQRLGNKLDRPSEPSRTKEHGHFSASVPISKPKQHGSELVVSQPSCSGKCLLVAPAPLEGLGALDTQEGPRSAVQPGAGRGAGLGRQLPQLSQEPLRYP